MQSNIISNDYLEQQRKLHAERKDYGISAAKHAQLVQQVCIQSQSKTLLDFGCGKGVLQESLPQFKVTQYDPAIERFSEYPKESHDCVYCGDVLEHVEPELLENVLDELHRLTNKVVILGVSTRPAKKVLADGRNAHLIVEPVEWWLPKIMARFTPIQLNNTPDHEFLFVGEPK